MNDPKYFIIFKMLFTFYQHFEFNIISNLIAHLGKTLPQFSFNFLAYLIKGIITVLINAF
jgi:hypothetical protein